ncbi:hypothetical protein EON65_40120 [archaeon]|nr:MAG: hypothetical protein EON65_40120 [archaeon]
MWSAPLLVATDVCELSDEKRAILMNKEVLAIHQDTLFTAAERLKRAADGTQVWTRPLANGDQAVVLFNANNDTALSVGFTWEEIGVAADKPMALRDLWNQKDLGTFTQSFSALVGVNDVLMIRTQAV